MMRRPKIARSIHSGIRNLVLHRLRSLLTMLGMIFGVGSVVAMVSVGEGAGRQALEQIQMLGSNNIIVNSLQPIEEEAAGRRRSHMSLYGLTYADHRRITDTFAAIKRVVPVKLLRKEARFGEQTLEARVVGTTAEWFELVPRPLLSGRVLNERDQERGASVVVLSETLARRLLALENPLGQMVKIGGSYFEVIGIIRSEAVQLGVMQTPDRQLDAYIPLNVVRERYGDIMVRRSAGSRVRERVELHQLIIQVDVIEQVESTASGLKEMLRRFHQAADYRIQVPLTLLRQAEATRRTFNVVLGAIAGISLLVGGIGIMNIMLANVTERTREIGIRRAIGAKRSQIMGQFLVETMVLSTTGGLLGILVGLAIPWLITRLTGLQTVVTPQSLVVSLGISMAVGLVFGLYPAHRAARLDPIEALRRE